jgi:hypothetical protein
MSPPVMFSLSFVKFSPWILARLIGGGFAILQDLVEPHALLESNSEQTPICSGLCSD